VSERQSQKEEEREGWSGIGEVPGPITRKGAVLKYLSRGPPEFIVTPLPMKRVCLISQGRFEQPVCSLLLSMSVFRPCTSTAFFG